MKIDIFIYNMIVIIIIYIVYDIMFIDMYGLASVNAFNNNDKCVYNININIKRNRVLHVYILSGKNTLLQLLEQ